MATTEHIPFFHGVYAIRNIRSGAMYIGCTRELKWRWQNHVSALRGGKHSQPALQEAWDADGCEAFELIMLEWVESREDKWQTGQALRDAEHKWLVELAAKGVMLYNRTVPERRIPVVAGWDVAELMTQLGFARPLSREGWTDAND